jgi:MFS family permease
MLAIATTIQIVATATVLALTAITPLVSVDLGVGPNWIGYQVSLVYFGGIFASATAGTFVRRYGPVAIEQVVLLTFVIGFLGLAGGSLVTVVLGSLAIGVGYGLNNPASSHILNAVTPPGKRNLVYSVKQSGVPLGAVVASLVFPPLAQVIGWKYAFLAASLLPLGVAGVLYFRSHALHFERDIRAPFIPGLLLEQRLVWSKPELRALAQLGFVYSGVQLSLSAFAVTMLVHDAHWSLLEAGSVAAVMQVGGAVGRILWGYVADRLKAGFAVLALLGGASGLLSFACIYTTEAHWTVQVAIMAALGLCASGWNGVHLAEAARAAPAGFVGPVTGGVLVYIFIGVMVWPAFFAAIFGLVGSYATAFGLFTVLSFAGALLALRMHYVQTFAKN